METQGTSVFASESGAIGALTYDPAIMQAAVDRIAGGGDTASALGPSAEALAISGTDIHGTFPSTYRVYEALAIRGAWRHTPSEGALTPGEYDSPGEMYALTYGVDYIDIPGGDGQVVQWAPGPGTFLGWQDWDCVTFTGNSSDVAADVWLTGDAPFNFAAPILTATGSTLSSVSANGFARTRVVMASTGHLLTVPLVIHLAPSYWRGVGAAQYPAALDCTRYVVGDPDPPNPVPLAPEALIQWPQYRYWMPGIPPLRQRQRDDGLTDDARRQSHLNRPTSLQENFRQTQSRNTYL
jgi:hypothetical protein